MTRTSPAPRPIETHTLDNGLRLVLHPDRSLPLVAINVWVHVGSKDESPGRTGLAHLFEHMLFQGSENVGTNDHFRIVQQVGGVANGSTAWDRTNYFETLPSNCLELGLWLESDRLGFLLPALTSEKLENQRSVVMNERRQRVDNQPYGRAFERLSELIYDPPHPYSWPIIGSMEDIAAATLDEVEDFFRTHYVPHNMVLTLAGDFDSGEALELVRRYFDPLPAGERGPRVTAPASPLDAERHEVLTDRVELARTYVAFQGPPATDDAWFEADLLASALAGGKSSPLFQDLVQDRQLALDVSCGVFPTELCSIFLLVATARQGVDVDRLQRALDGHLEDAASHEPPSTELERARNRTLTAYVDQLQSLDTRADVLSRLTTLYDEPDRIDRELELYRGITGSDLRDFAAGRLGSHQRAVVHVVPEETG